MKITIDLTKSTLISCEEISLKKNGVGASYTAEILTADGDILKLTGYIAKTIIDFFKKNKQLKSPFSDK